MGGNKMQTEQINWHEVRERIGQMEGGNLNFAEGLLFGDDSSPITGIQVCWMATVGAIEAAARGNANLIIAHEALFYPYPGIRTDAMPHDYMAWRTNRRRIEALSKNNISVVRIHSTMDRMCISDEFIRVLGLGEPKVVSEGFKNIYEIEPATIRCVLERVKKAVNMERVRITPCDLDKVVRRIGVLFGGSALFVNVTGQQMLMRYNPDLFIAGESDCYGFLFATDAGVPMIETSHEVSENPGIGVFAERLRKKVPVPVTYYENPRCWDVG